jgi:hypothetical protein
MILANTRYGRLQHVCMVLTSCALRQTPDRLLLRHMQYPHLPLQTLLPPRIPRCIHLILRRILLRYQPHGWARLRLRRMRMIPSSGHARPPHRRGRNGMHSRLITRHMDGMAMLRLVFLLFSLLLHGILLLFDGVGIAIAIPSHVSSHSHHDTGIDTVTDTYSITSCRTCYEHANHDFVCFACYAHGFCVFTCVLLPFLIASFYFHFCFCVYFRHWFLLRLFVLIFRPGLLTNLSFSPYTDASRYTNPHPSLTGHPMERGCRQ